MAFVPTFYGSTEFDFLSGGFVDILIMIAALYAAASFKVELLLFHDADLIDTLQHLARG